MAYLYNIKSVIIVNKYFKKIEKEFLFLRKSGNDDEDCE